MLLTPIVAVILLEGDNSPTEDKIGILFILYIQLFWGYRILFNISEKLMEAFGPVSKDKKPPLWVLMFHNVFSAMNYNKNVKIGVAVV
jgi:hypothetical protein